MEQRLSLVTLAVRDLEAASGFYGRLGWQPGFANDDVAFYQLNGIVLSLWRRDAMAAELGCDPASLGPGGIALAHNVGSAQHVDTTLAEAEEAGATIQAPKKQPWGGYSGYVSDVDGHRWEIAWNPDWPIAADGGVRPFAPP